MVQSRFLFTKRQWRICQGLTNLAWRAKIWRWGGLASDTRKTSGIGQKEVGKQVAMFSSAMATDSTMEKRSAPKKKKDCEGFFKFFVIPLSPTPDLYACPSSHGARESISVDIPFDRLRKNGAIMQKSNASQVRRWWTIWWKEELSCVRCSRPLYRERVVCGVVIMSMKK
jgi:hypothetical protein